MSEAEKKPERPGKVIYCRTEGLMIYRQSSGLLTEDKGVAIATGYSGNGALLNNPDGQNAADHGPIPRGWYDIRDPVSPVDHLGPYALPLIPHADNLMFGRGGFFIHGDNAQMNHTASCGCIVLPPGARRAIAYGADRSLEVTE